MIKLEISGENTNDFAQQLAAVAQLMAGTVASAAAPAKPARGKSSTGPAGDTATTQGAAASGASDTSDAPITRESVAAKCTQYGSPQKGGAAALKQLFVEFGSANGKWSEITDDKLGALNARLDELLA